MADDIEKLKMEFAEHMADSENCDPDHILWEMEHNQLFYDEWNVCLIGFNFGFKAQAEEIERQDAVIARLADPVFFDKCSFDNPAGRIQDRKDRIEYAAAHQKPEEE